MSKVNYMSMKTDALEALAKEREIDISFYMNSNGSYNRQAISNIMKMWDAANTVQETPTLVEADGEVTENPKPSKFKKGFEGVFTKIIFYNLDENDLPYVQLALNGNALYIPKEREVWIPKEFLDGCLKNAIITKLKQHVGQDGKISYIPRQVQRHSYQVLDMKHIDEIPKEK